MTNFIFFILLFFSSHALSNAQVGSVSLLRGKAHVLRGDNKAIPLKESSAIFSGDTIETGDDGLLKILYDDNSMQVIEKKSKIIVNEVATEEEGSSYFTLLFGKLKSVVGKRDKEREYKLNAGDVSLGVRGTNFVVDFYDTTGGPNVYVTKGSVVATSQSKEDKDSGEDSKKSSDKDKADGKKKESSDSKKENSTQKNKSSVVAKKTTSRSVTISKGQSFDSSQPDEAVAMPPAVMKQLASDDAVVDSKSVSAASEAQAQSDSSASEVLEAVDDETNDAIKQAEEVKAETALDNTETINSIKIQIQPVVRSLVENFEDIQ